MGTAVDDELLSLKEALDKLGYSYLLEGYGKPKYFAERLRTSYGLTSCKRAYYKRSHFFTHLYKLSDVREAVEDYLARHQQRRWIRRNRVEIASELASRISQMSKHYGGRLRVGKLYDERYSQNGSYDKWHAGGHRAINRIYRIASTKDPDAEHLGDILIDRFDTLLASHGY